MTADAARHLGSLVSGNFLTLYVLDMFWKAEQTTLVVLTVVVCSLPNVSGTHICAHVRYLVAVFPKPTPVPDSGFYLNFPWISNFERLGVQACSNMRAGDTSISMIFAYRAKFCRANNASSSRRPPMT